MTNESLQAIVKGMNIQGNDDIVAVCSEGYQAAAMAQYANSVYAVDIAWYAVKNAERNAKLIRKGKFKELLEASWEFNRTYFSEEGRLERIRERIGRVTFNTYDITQIFTSQRFSKVYFSNIFQCIGCDVQRDLPRAILGKAAESLMEPGLIYVADGLYVDSFDLPNTIARDEELTQIARQIEAANGTWWVPSVYRKISHEVAR